MNSYIPTNWKPRKNGQVSRNLQTFNTESGRSRKSEQTDH